MILIKIFETLQTKVYDHYHISGGDCAVLESFSKQLQETMYVNKQGRKTVLPSVHYLWLCEDKEVIF